jgi:hypothetical protein
MACLSAIKSADPTPRDAGRDKEVRRAYLAMRRNRTELGSIDHQQRTAGEGEISAGDVTKAGSRTTRRVRTPSSVMMRLSRRRTTGSSTRSRSQVLSERFQPAEVIEDASRKAGASVKHQINSFVGLNEPESHVELVPSSLFCDNSVWFATELHH